MPVDPSIKKLSVTRNDEADARSATFNFFLAGGMVRNDGLPMHPSQARDAYLRQTLYLPFHDFWSGAVSIAVVKMISKDFEITSDAPRLRQYAQDLHILADAGEGWISFLSKIVQDFLCTDNGAFVEIVRASKAAGSRILGIMHLDSLRVTRTGNGEIPAIYRDTLGVEHELQAHQVMMFADMPSPAETHHGVGLCAASRAWGQIVKLEAIERYIYDKVSGKRSLSLEIVKGIADKDIRTAIDSAREMRKADSVLGKAYSYMGATIMAVLQDVPLEHISIPFASLPDGFDRAKELSIALLAFANAIGLDPQDLEPLTGQAIGTGAQSQVLHEKAAGKGLAAFTKQWTHMDNEMLMPDAVTFAFKEKDLGQDKQRSDIEKVRTDTQAVRIDKGIITAPQAAQILADAGDLPKEFVPVDVTPTETVGDEDKVSAEPDKVTPPAPELQPAPVAKEAQPSDAGDPFRARKEYRQRLAALSR